MSDVMEHVAYLSQEIGPRPAGTEEEQQAALYITERFQQDAGLPAVIEDFSGVSNAETPRAICSGVTLVFGILALALPVVALPAALIALVSAALFVAESLGRPLLSRLFSRGVSQNVVAKYEPGYSPEAGRSRRRKVVIIAHYDSGKTCPELSLPILPVMHIVKWIVFGAFIAVPVLLLLGTTLLLNVSSAVSTVLNVLVVIGLVFCALPLVQFIIHKVSAYNDGANCNASGVAVMMEVAERIGRGRTDMSQVSDMAGEVTIHGEQAAHDAGVIPEGVQVNYAVSATPASEDDSNPAARLAAAKAAVAALSGKPVSDFVSDEVLSASVHIDMVPSAAAQGGEQDQQAAAVSVAEEAQQVQAEEAAQVQVPVQDAVAAPAPAAEEQSALPSWFVQAQKKAKRNEAAEKPVQRSRYADALEVAVNESRAHFEEANNVVLHNAEERIAAMSDGIVEVKAPEAAWLQNQEVQQAAPQAPVQEAPQAVSQAPVQEEPQVVSSQEEPAVQAQGYQAAPAESILPADMQVPPVSGVEEISVPSFLTEPSRQIAPVEERSSNRVDVTSAVVGEDGQLEPSASAAMPPVAEAPAQPAAPAAPVFVDAVTASVDQATADFPAIAEATSGHGQRSISLPSIGITGEIFPAAEMSKQRAPLAETGSHKEGDPRDPKNRLSALPAIDPLGSAVDNKGAALADLRSSLPSLSGSLPRMEEGASTVSLTGSFAPVGATSALAPVGDELLEDVDPDEIYVDDADDSAYDQGYTDSGAFAGPGYVEMPKSRVGRLFGRFGRKKEEDQSTPQEWLNVDEGFEARSVGAARGSWESFREDDDGQSGLPPQAQRYDIFQDAGDPAATTAFEPYDASEISQNADGYEYEGGYDPNAGEYSYDDAFAEDDFGGDYDDSSSRRGKRGRRWFGGAFSRVRMGRADLRSGREEEVPLDGDPAPMPPAEAPEMKQIYEFRNPDIDTEVWFVALGAELSGNGGMRAFMEEHAQELRGSIVIELEALGAGELCMTDAEGCYVPTKTSSRMRRLTRKATQATGVSVGSTSMKWKGSTSSYAISHGLQAMHLVGMDGLKPALYGQAGDTAEAVDEQLLNERASFVMELIKGI